MDNNDKYIVVCDDVLECEVPPSTWMHVQCSASTSIVHTMVNVIVIIPMPGVKRVSSIFYTRGSCSACGSYSYVRF